MVYILYDTINNNVQKQIKLSYSNRTIDTGYLWRVKRVVAERTLKGNFTLPVMFFLDLGPGNKCAFTLSKSTHLGFVHLSVYMSYFNKFLFKTHREVN